MKISKNIQKASENSSTLKLEDYCKRLKIELLFWQERALEAERKIKEFEQQAGK